jgi:hypothetical protein
MQLKKYFFSKSYYDYLFVMHYTLCYFIYNAVFFSFLCLMLRVSVCKEVLRSKLKEMTSKID